MRRHHLCSSNRVISRYKRVRGTDMQSTEQRTVKQCCIGAAPPASAELGGVAAEVQERRVLEAQGQPVDLLQR